MKITLLTVGKTDGYPDTAMGYEAANHAEAGRSRKQ